MAIQVKQSALQKLGAKIHETPKSPFVVSLLNAKPLPAPAPQVNLDGLQSVVTVALDSQRREMAGFAQQIAGAIAQLRIPVGWQGNWNVSITKRDALGRISEVQFRPAKP